MRLARLLLLPAAFLLALTLSGCSTSFSPQPETPAGTASIGPVQVSVHGGQQPIVGAHIYVFAAGTGGYGTASTSLITDTTNPDTTTFPGKTIYYEISGAQGTFNLASDFTCTQGTQVYIYAVGGNPGVGTNANAGLLAGLGQCPTTGGTLASVTPQVNVDEISTIAFAYAMAGYATDATHVASSGTALAKTGIANAMANIPNIINVALGTAYTTSNTGGGAVPQSKINALADILAACINSTGGSPGDGSSCGKLFEYVTSNGVSCTSSCTNTASDTATAAIYMAKNPWNAPSTVFNLASTKSPFSPADSSDTDWAIGITYPFIAAGGGNAVITDASGKAYASTSGHDETVVYTPLGVSSAIPMTSVAALAFDSSGNLWATTSSPALLEVPFGTTTASTITPMNNSNSTDALEEAIGLAFDPAGHLWVADNSRSDVVELSSTGAYIATVTGGGFVEPFLLSIDSSSNIWVPNLSGTSAQITEISNGTASAFANIISYGDTIMTAIDSGQNVWAANGSSCKCVLHIAKGASSGTSISLPSASEGIAIDGAGNAFVSSDLSAEAIYEINNAGTQLTGSNGYATSFTTSYIDADISGNIWVLGVSHIEQFLGLATPVVRPLSPSTAGTKP